MVETAAQLYVKREIILLVIYLSYFMNLTKNQISNAADLYHAIKVYMNSLLAESWCLNEKSELPNCETFFPKHCHPPHENGGRIYRE